jgi:nicotinate phosphoribosyltransferase
MGDTVEATRAFRNIIAKKTKCISLIDTFNDEKFEALNVARGMGKALYGMRIDTPASRRGDLAAILAEVRWELDLRGFKQVKIFVIGGLDELKIAELNPWTDGYGIGTRIAGAPVVDFSYDIVEIDGTPVAKRGKEAGAKKLMRCPRCLGRSNSPARAKAVRCACGARMESIHEVLMRDGKPVRRSDAVAKIRGRTLREVKKLTF